MPKSKVRKKADYTAPNRTPVSIKAGPSPIWYVVVMLGFMLAGLLWLVVYYLAGTSPEPGKWIKWMADLEAWNFLIGFGLMIVGLVMTMRWR